MGSFNSSLRSKALMFGLVLAWAFFDVAAQPLVQPRGTDTTFDLVTWNVHEFPGSGFRTIDTLAVLIQDLDIDIVGMQEIADTNAFYQLLERLPGWDGLFAPYDYSGYPYLKTGVLWRTDRATVDYVEQLFVGYQYQFPRPPIHVYAAVDFGQYQFDFHLIVLHLKAGDTDDDRLRRQAAVLMLKAYLDNNIPGAPDQDWIVIGDWNDELDDEQSQNVFWPLLTDSLSYRFLTLPLAGNPYWASYPSFNSLIDHLMISAFANDEYGSGNTITLRLDDEYPNYRNRISDHRPVMSQFLGHYTGVDESLPDDVDLFAAYPNPFNCATSLSFCIEQPSNVSLEIFDILGRKVATLQRGWLEKGHYRMDFSGDGASSGIYFARLQYSSNSQTIKLTLLK